ncbi:MAG: FtsW/RodA/SpoVE family cell cycle protein [Nocardioidaceae bacterium]|jgi:cell division protein FtsW (lipid II flippase)|nr:FtsW/RodA/SpoVE family cell cycle protein [Nocardioidaceae bacterium]
MTAGAVEPSTDVVPRKRRGTELFLLVLALLVGVGAYVAVGIGYSGDVPADVAWVAGGFVTLALVAHVAVRLLAPYADPVLLPLVAMLNGLGLAMIRRLDLDFAAADQTTFATQQMVWTLIGVIAFVAVLVVVPDHRRLQSFTYTLGLLAIVLLVLPLLPVIGQEINGSRIWIRIGPLGFQPGEVAKICLVVFFAGYLVVKRDALALAGRRFLGIDLPRGRDLGPILTAWLVSLGVLVFQRDLGSSLLFFGLFVVMLYVATERVGWAVVGTLLFLGGAYFSYLTFGHVEARVTGWLDPFSDTDAYYQIVQGLYGLGFGGLIGTGLGQGDPTLTPFSYSDFIVTSLGEELGLTGLMAIIVVYGLVVERGLRVALLCRDAFGKLVAAGLAVSMALQVFVVVGGVTRLIPLTGLTTPFLSYGGSSLVVNWAMVALLLRISHFTREPQPLVTPLDAGDATQVVRLR